MKLRITVHGASYDVDVEILDAGDELRQGQALSSIGVAASPPSPGAPPPVGPGTVGATTDLPGAARPGQGHGVTSPIAGTLLELRVKPGDSVLGGQPVAVLEAMKMKTEIAAPGAGQVARCPIAAGDAVREGQMLVEFT